VSFFPLRLYTLKYEYGSLGGLLIHMPFTCIFFQFSFYMHIAYFLDMTMYILAESYPLFRINLLRPSSWKTIVFLNIYHIVSNFFNLACLETSGNYVINLICITYVIIQLIYESA
jgi:hypothetical protein